MDVDRRYLAKADTALQEALRRAESDEIVRAVLILEEPASSADAPAAPHPDAFGSREKYRRASIDHRKAVLERLKGTLDALRALPLEVRGGEVGRAVVIEGPAARVLQSLELPAVGRALLDREVELIRPRQSRGGAKAAPQPHGGRRPR